MDHYDPNKRFKSANGAPMPTPNAAANLPAYQPPAPPMAMMGGRSSRYVLSSRISVLGQRICDARGCGVAIGRSEQDSSWGCGMNARSCIVHSTVELPSQSPNPRGAPRSTPSPNMPSTRRSDRNTSASASASPTTPDSTSVLTGKEACRALRLKWLQLTCSAVQA